MLEFNMSAEDAINKPKFHHLWLPDQIDIEKDFAAAAKKQLEAMGYKIVERTAIGRTEVIEIKYPSASARVITAVGDKRGDDDARGY
jgi:gamma-glutamyltranspeptidase/glutathione hydrolase